MPHAGEVEPLDGARVVIAAVGGLVGVDGELHGRGVALLLGLALLLLGRLGPFLPRLQGQLIRRVVHHRSIPRGVVGVTALTGSNLICMWDGLICCMCINTEPVLWKSVCSADHLGF
uniref:Uncharacterized protein n=1 Tax=Oncorhynchus mykiss TaxID=8022 RepID=A0A8K9XDB2_ONCMY